jgi:diguanylate cyclase (GGDEF)-like protein
MIYLTEFTENLLRNRAIVGLPLKLGKKVIGVMNIAFQKPQPFHEEQLRVMGLLSDQAAIAIENARLHNLVIQQSLTDILTNLPNRRAFEAKLEDEIRRSHRYKHPFTLVMLDLNGFKIINDTLGHQVGDQALKLFGQFLIKNIRDTDFAARLGGDEFVMFFPETGLAQASTVMKKINKDLKIYPYPWFKTHPEIEISLAEGLALYPDDGKNLKDLLDVADKRSYLNKPDNSRYPKNND